MEKDVIRRLYKGAGANFYNQAITAVVQLAGVPILLYAWGSELYGEWLILFAVPAYLSMAGLGFSQSAGNDMTARVARNDYIGALRVFQSVAALGYLAATLGLLGTTFLLWQAPLEDWFDFSEMGSRAAWWVLWLLAAEVFVRLASGPIYAGFRANGEYALNLGINSTVRLLQYSGVWLAALAGNGPVVAALIYFLVRLVSTPWLAVLLVRRHLWLNYGFAHASRHELHRLFKPAMACMAIPLAQALNVQGMVLVIGMILGPVAVVIFSTLRTLTRFVLQLIYSISNATEPEIASAYGAGKASLVQALYLHSLRAAFWLAMLAAAGLAVCGSSILAVWTHGDVAMQPMLFTWLLGSAVASVLWYGPMSVLKAANRHLAAASFLVVVSAASVCVSAMILEMTDDLADAGLILLAMDLVLFIYTMNSTSNLHMNSISMFAKALNPFPLLNMARAKINS